MRLLLLLLTLATVTLGVAIPAPDTAFAPRGDSTDASEGNGEWIENPIWTMYQDAFYRGLFGYVGDDHVLTQNPESAHCWRNTVDKTSSMILHAPEDWRSNIHCYIYDGSDCSGNQEEIYGSHLDLRIIGWNDRIISMKCWYIV